MYISAIFLMENYEVFFFFLPRYQAYFQDSPLAFVLREYADLAQILILFLVLLYIQ